MQDLHTYIIKTSFDFPPYHSNAYLLELKDGLFLFDTGIKSESSIEFLKKQIDKTGKLDGIILSHGHLDHSGCASILADYYSVPIYISLNEKDRIGNNFNERLLRRLDKISKIIDFFQLDKKNIQLEREKANYYKNLLEPIEFCFNVEKLNLTDIEILELPGHTSGSIGLYHKKEKILFSGDALLKEGISSFFDPDLFIDSLALYLESLEKIKNLELSAILPGHGNIIKEPYKVIELHFQYVQKNQQKIRDLIQNNIKIPDIYKATFPENQNLLIALSELIHCLNTLKIPILQNLKDLLSE